MNDKKSQDEKKVAASMILPVAGAIVGAAVMAVAVRNQKNQKRAKVLLEQVKNKASSYMKKAQEEVAEGKKKVDKTLDVVEDSDKKVAGIWKK